MNQNMISANEMIDYLLEKQAGVGDAIGKIGNKLTPIKNQRLIGAGLGAGAGALVGASNNNDNKAGGMLSGALIGAGAGAVGGHLAKGNAEKAVASSFKKGVAAGTGIGAGVGAGVGANFGKIKEGLNAKGLRDALKNVDTNKMKEKLKGALDGAKGAYEKAKGKLGGADINGKIKNASKKTKEIADKINGATETLGKAVQENAQTINSIKDNVRGMATQASEKFGDTLFEKIASEGMTATQAIEMELYKVAHEVELKSISATDYVEKMATEILTGFCDRVENMENY